MLSGTRIWAVLEMGQSLRSVFWFGEQSCSPLNKIEPGVRRQRFWKQQSPGNSCSYSEKAETLQLDESRRQAYLREVGASSIANDRS
jgi:hypothetical protein